MKNAYMYLTWSVIILLFFVCPVVISFVFNWSFKEIPEISINAYILWNFLHFGLQALFCILNYRWINKLEIKEDQKKVGLQMVGWREDPKLFRAALESIKTLHGYKQFVFVSDGNEKEDLYLQAEFLSVFQNAHICSVDGYLYDNPYLWEKIKKYRYVCVFQKHKGKRHALYSAFKYFIWSGVDYILTTDSDTVFHPNCLIELKKLAEHTNAGACTGMVQIYNIDNFQAFLIAMKYWIAFFIERGAQSYHGVVSCVAGPLGFYRVKSLENILEKWLHQEFLGEECTYGDDRHLTNLILSKGKQIYYTHKAIVWTETPVTLKRWILQQMRWGRSFIRELFLNFAWFHKQHIWLACDLIFVSLYSIILIVALLLLLFQFKFTNILYFTYGILIVSLIRGIFGAWYHMDIRYVYFMFFGVLYVFLLLPVKLWALCTLKQRGWGTSTRKVIKDSGNISMIPVILWNLIIWGGIITTIVLDPSEFLEPVNFWLAVGLGSLSLTMAIIYYIFNKSILRNTINEHVEIEMV